MGVSLSGRILHISRYLKLIEISFDVYSDIFEDIGINHIFIEISMTIFWCICNVEKDLLTYFEISFFRYLRCTAAQMQTNMPYGSAEGKGLQEALHNFHERQAVLL